MNSDGLLVSLLPFQRECKAVCITTVQRGAQQLLFTFTFTLTFTLMRH
jgi:hypothetical protein